MNPSPETQKALDRLRSSPDFRQYEKHLADRLQYLQEKLVSAPATDFAQLQGRAMEVRDLLKLKP